MKLIFTDFEVFSLTAKYCWPIEFGIAGACLQAPQICLVKSECCSHNANIPKTQFK